MLLGVDGPNMVENPNESYNFLKLLQARSQTVFHILCERAQRPRRQGGSHLNFDWKSWFFEVWEENRRLTNRIVRSLTETGALDQTPVAGMRSFREMLIEIWEMERGYIEGLALGNWRWEPGEHLKTLPIDEFLAYGRTIREQTRRLWPSISMETLLQPRRNPFWEGPEEPAIAWLTYALENEIHHRGQAYVYLRLIGKQPPEFYVRTE
jgi:uncharacterized damage-inducible protein DinB